MLDARVGVEPIAVDVLRAEHLDQRRIESMEIRMLRT